MALRENPRFCNNEVTGAGKKLENFWYYYKWWVLAGLFALVAAAVFISDFVNKEKYDSVVVVVSSGGISFEDSDALDQFLDGVVEDGDGNGERNVSVISVLDYRNENSANAYATDMQFMVQTQNEEANIWLIDTATKEYLEAAGIFSAVFDGEAVPLEGLFGRDETLSAFSSYWLARKLATSGESELYLFDMSFADALEKLAQ